MGKMDADVPVRHYAIVPRDNLKFGFDGDIPKYWFDGDPFKTRFFDAFSIRLPEGERFFVACLRDYKDQIKDPKLRQEIRDFTRQEGQHSMIHRLFNQRLEAQGIPVTEMDTRNGRIVDRFRTFRRPIPLAQTCAGEHLTATLSHLLFENPELFRNCDRRVLAMFMWHAAEEIEHKSVAFDVLTHVAGASHRLRTMTCMFMSPAFFLHTFYLMDRIFRIDGFSAAERLGLWRRGLVWLFGKGGVMRRMAPHYFAYYRRDFDPWKVGDATGYERWLKSYNRDGDPLHAVDAALAEA